jgi:hypothetical protein
MKAMYFFGYLTTQVYIQWRYWSNIKNSPSSHITDGEL